MLSSGWCLSHALFSKIKTSENLLYDVLTSLKSIVSREKSAFISFLLLFQKQAL